MAKTRRKKLNKSPGKPYRNARAHIVDKGDTVTVRGVRGRTTVKRVTNEEGMRLTSVRITETVPQIIAKPVGDRKPKRIFVGRVYSGVARSKVYPVRGIKRGGVALPLVRTILPGLGAPLRFMARAASAMKRVATKRVVVAKTEL
jgi:hypothetical protein